MLPSGPPPPPPRVVVVAVPGLRWDELSPSGTPELLGLARRGAAGALSVKTAAPHDCPADGWLTLYAGNRARVPGLEPAPCPAARPIPADLPALARLNERLADHADPLDLETALAREPGVAQLLAAPAVTGPADAAAADAFVAEVDRGRAPGSTLLVVGLSEAPGQSGPHLHVALADGPGFPPGGSLLSASTRRAPYVQLVDVAPTVLSLLHAPRPTDMIGQPWQVAAGTASPAQLADLDRRAQGQRRSTGFFYAGLVLLQAVLLTALWRRPRAAATVALLGAAAPAGTFLAALSPWWRAEPPLLGLVAAAGTAAAALTALALLGPWRRSAAGPLAAVCAATALLLLLDLLTGAHLQIASVTGYSPYVAGRFAGIGNPAFGVLGTAALLALALAGRPRLTLAAGLALVLVVGGPPWGSKVGGVLTAVPALAVLWLLQTGRRITWPRVLGAAAAGLLIVLGLAGLDHLRPASHRTHLARFLDQLGNGSAAQVIRRKAAADLGLLFHSPLTALLPVAVAVAVLVVVRPPAALRQVFVVLPGFRAGLLAVGALSAVGFLVNDSGAAIPALAIVVAAPATLFLVSRLRCPPGALP